LDQFYLGPILFKTPFYLVLFKIIGLYMHTILQPFLFKIQLLFINLTFFIFQASLSAFDQSMRMVNKIKLGASKA